MIKVILFLLAWFLMLPATLANYIIVMFKGKHKGYFLDSAIRLDVYGCGEFRTLWNTILITKNGIKFKKDGHTISYYLGANLVNKTLSKFGYNIAKLLDKLDDNHCIRCYYNETLPKPSQLVDY